MGNWDRKVMQPATFTTESGASHSKKVSNWFNCLVRCDPLQTIRRKVSSCEILVDNFIEKCLYFNFLQFLGLVISSDFFNAYDFFFLWDVLI